ncbi:MAG: hypothetical protein H6Q17_2267 [Bacteroidetes bacterium]|nr:hypothetical protein [Bacteroidota bacterium]
MGSTAAGTAPGLFSETELTGFPLRLFSRIEKQSPNAMTKVRKGLKNANIFSENDFNNTFVLKDKRMIAFQK